MLGNQIVAVSSMDESSSGEQKENGETNKQNSPKLHGCLLQVENSSNFHKTSSTTSTAHPLNGDDDDDDDDDDDGESQEGTQTVHMPAVWQDVYEWHHTHQPTTISLLQNKPNRWQRAAEWCQVAQALHGEDEEYD